MIGNVIRARHARLSFLDHISAGPVALADGSLRSIGDHWMASERELQKSILDD